MREANSGAASAGSPGGRLARNAFFLLVGQVASTGLSLILNAVLGRWLGVAEFGTYYLLAMVSTFAYVFVDWGQSAYLVRESARCRSDVGMLLGGAIAFRAAVACVAAPVSVVTVKAIGFDDRLQFLALLSVVCGLPLALAQTYGYIFRGRDRTDLDAAVAITAKGFTVGVTVPALLLGGGLVAAVCLQAVGGVCAWFVAVLLAQRVELRIRRPTHGVLKELASNGTPIAIFFVVLAVQPFVDAIVLSKLVPPEAVGWYGAARNIIGVLTAPALILGTASLPELSRASASAPDLNRAMRTSVRLLLVVGALATVGAFLFADFAVALLYGKGHFDPAAAVLQAYAPIFPLIFLDILLGHAIIAVGKTKEMAIVKLTSVVVSTGSALLLIPVCQARFGNGGIGLVLAFGSTEILMLTAFVWLLPGGAVDRRMVLDFLRATIAAGGTVAILAALPSVTPWLGMIITVVVFLALAFASGLVLQTDLDEVVDLVRGHKAPRELS